jgi:hypothetical protein
MVQRGQITGVTLAVVGAVAQELKKISWQTNSVQQSLWL